MGNIISGADSTRGKRGFKGGVINRESVEKWRGEGESDV
jgi:hypothetical protein